MSRVKAFCDSLAAAGSATIQPAAGVYVILNTVTMRAYIGKSENVPRRFDVHRAALRAGRHHNRALQEDWDTYGPACFTFAPFAYVDDIDSLERDLISESPDAYNWAVPAHGDRGQGRKPLPPEDATKPRSVRLNDARWEKLKRLGSEWLSRTIDRAKDPK